MALRRLLLALAMAVSCLSPLAAAPPATTDVPAVVTAMKKRFGVAGLPEGGVEGLAGLVALQRSVFPEASITSGFYDWRGLSRYRSNPGLHLGYDLAMPAGSPVRVGWPGTVVSVAPWTDGEWGLTVLSPSGVEVTYGHLVPRASVGEVLAAGDVVGTIALDHVDVKMRDRSGNYVDFGGGAAPSTPFDRLPMTSQQTRMVAWLVARNALETSEFELAGRKREKALGSIERRRLEARVAELKAQVPLMARYVEEGLVARVEAEQVRADLARARKNLEDLVARQRRGPVSLASLEQQVRAARNRLAAVEREARRQGITWAQVTGFVNGVVAEDARLRQQVLDFKRTGQVQKAKKVEDLRREVREGRSRVRELQTLYEMGGLPRREMEAARARQEALEAELKALGG